MENDLTNPQYWADAIERDILEPDKITTHLGHLRQTLRRAPQPDALVEAATRLLHACERADEDGELALTIDGTLLDDVRTALAAPRPERAYSAEDAIQLQRAAFIGCLTFLTVKGWIAYPSEVLADVQAEAESRYREHKEKE